MKIFGIKECGIKKYLSGTLEGGILKLSEEGKFNLYLELMKKQYPGAYTDSTPIWSYIKPSKEIKSYNEFLNDLKSTNPEEYNRLMENAAQSRTSEISKPWIDAKGNVRRSTNVGAGFVSGTDPVGALYVEGVATAPVFNLIGRAAQYGLARAGNNWARAKILSKEMLNIVGDGLRYFGKVKYYGPTMGKTTASKTNPDLVDFDDFTREAKETLAKKLNISTRVLQTDPKYALAYLEMLEKQLDSWRRNPLNANKTLVISKKGLADKNIYNNLPSIPDRQTFIQRLRNRGETDDANSNDWYNMLLKQNPNLRIDNRFVSEIEYNPHYIGFLPMQNSVKTLTGYSFNFGGIKQSQNLKIDPNKNYQASIGNPVLIKLGTEYYMPNLLIEEVKRGKEAAAKFFEHPVVLLSYKHNLELAEKLGITIPNRPENIGNIIRLPVKIRWSGAPSNSHAAVAQTHLGDPDAVISYLWMPFDRKSFGITTIHENLHRGFYSAPLKFPNISKEYYDNIYKPLYSFYNWKTKKLLKPEYYDSYLADISGGEAGPNFIDLGRDLGLKLGLKYPGYEEANNILLNYTGFKSWMIPQLNTSKAGMRHVWDAMTGKYFTIPAGGVLINHTILSNSGKAKLYLDGGSVKKILTGMIPIYGTYQDAKEFINNPTLENFGWTVASGLGDVFFFTGLGAGIKGLKVANAARKAKSVLKAKRADKLLDARRNYYNTKLGVIDGSSTSREMKQALQSLGASVDNFRNMERKYNLATRAYNQEMKSLGVKSTKEIGKDGVIQTTLYITE